MIEHQVWETPPKSTHTRGKTLDTQANKRYRFVLIAKRISAGAEKRRKSAGKRGKSCGRRKESGGKFVCDSLPLYCAKLLMLSILDSPSPFGCCLVLLFLALSSYRHHRCYSSIPLLSPHLYYIFCSVFSFFFSFYFYLFSVCWEEI